MMMALRALVGTFFLLLWGSGAQSQISYEFLTDLPEPVSNNAVASVEIDGKWYIYSFSGIDSTKLYSGIHAKVFRFDVETGVWSALGNLPGNQPRIAAGASTIRGKIYVLGGYEVFQNGTEVSINNLHVFDPVSNTFEPDAIPIPTPIDDQVQVVYKDSLLYSITGWSNTGNVDEVWIYDVVEESWQEGTKTPIAASFQAFGASGAIVGDTIYFIGGAMSLGGFPASNRLRKGYINPNDPSDIEWSAEPEENGISYRPGAAIVDGKAFWLGGSLRTYNYNGIAYSDNTGVDATNRIVFYNPTDGTLIEQFYNFPEIMDLRGLVSLGPNQFVSVGGMTMDQKVSDKVVLYHIDNLVSTASQQTSVFQVLPTISTGAFQIHSDQWEGSAVQIVDRQGKLIAEERLTSSEHFMQLSIPTGTYFVQQLQDGIGVNRQVIFIR